MAWKTVRADEFCSFVTDGTHDSPKPQSQGRKLITSKHLKGDYIDFDSANWISEGDYQKIIARSAVEQWDILFSMIGTIGTIYLEKNPIVEYACKNMGVFKFAGNAENACWMYYYLKSPQAKEYIQSHLRGSTQAYVPLGSLREMPVLIPDRETRNCIVSLLKPLDEKIAINRAINDNLEQQAQAIFKSWFVNFEPFNGTMPYNWTICALGDITEMGAGGDKPKEASPVKTLSHQYPIYSNGINNYGLYGYANEPKIKDESVTVSARGTIGYVCLRHHPYVPIVRLVTLIPDVNVVSAKYLYLYLRQLHIAGTGTTQQQLTVPDFRKTEIVIPDKTTMGAFTEAVTPIFEQIWANEDENIKLAEIRDALLPKLMSGELDVSAVEF